MASDWNPSSISQTVTCGRCDSLNSGFATLCCGCGRVIARIADGNAVCQSCRGKNSLTAESCCACRQSITLAVRTGILRPLPCIFCPAQNLPGAEHCQSCFRTILRAKPKPESFNDGWQERVQRDEERKREAFKAYKAAFSQVEEERGSMAPEER